ncbi:hypothetical protein FAF44_07320 [Nonomuraea sp. MG754425]|uniref:aminoacyl-tRNA deacylase n=1 Tax=Nonomuraea sp. MG754425 TaxID=2570319 RepID=UPI001F1BDCDD|nr:YbaK/EbsC family protein [Nonomuraea sp. MG754425]MCF6468210.1 hypothetical protein [Nonomuraea sp. MG754425]
MKDALAIHRRLLAHQIHHEIVRLPRPMTCAEELPEAVRAAPERCLMVTVLEVTTWVGHDVVVAVATPVSSPPRPGAVGGLLRARQVRPARAHVVNATTDYAAGLVCPLLLPESLPMYIDDRLPTDGEPIFTTTGERHTVLSLRALDLLGVLPGKMVNLRGSRPGRPRGAVARQH